ncbi:hypothetical protein NRI_0788 [Neorickettsia risticii str. Illinois]|uniref:Uncharacterized protein n=1 Tax=Neorickettsia risticii (strain Illinois) TaxID=434131 RepID=C6V5U2_NEORI|nr:hypothetical protein NRI_0788 [Neorickettsia risticii str. Illinois]
MALTLMSLFKDSTNRISSSSLVSFGSAIVLASIPSDSAFFCLLRTYT